MNDDSKVLHRTATFEDKLFSVKQNGVSNAAQRGAEEKMNLWKMRLLMIELFNVFTYEVKSCENDSSFTLLQLLLWRSTDISLSSI